MITREALRVLENNLKFARLVNRQYDDKFAVEGAKIGTALNIRKPPRYLGRTGTALSLEDSIEQYTTLTLNTQAGVDVSFTSAELALSIDDFSERILKPAVATIANKIDLDGLALYKKVYNVVGVPGTLPNDLKTYLQSGGALDDEATPQDGLRSLVINPDSQIEIVDALKGLFQSGDKISEQYKTGRMGTAVGFEWQMDQNVRQHLFGSPGGPLAVNTTITVAGTTTVLIKGATATTGDLHEGDVITIDGVYAVNPQSRETTGKLRKFVLTALATANGSGVISAILSPAIYIYTDKLATVDAYPVQDAAVNVVGGAAVTSPQNLAFHRDAFCLGMADLPLPRGVDMAGRVSDKQLGMSIRLVRAYDITTDSFPCRLDVLYGWTALYPQLACRIAG
jgi:hypothetical protein